MCVNIDVAFYHPQRNARFKSYMHAYSALLQDNFAGAMDDLKKIRALKASRLASILDSGLYPYSPTRYAKSNFVENKSRTGFAQMLPRHGDR